ncbi:type II toxin-antitoxin system Phd/YefM family antitoxin [Salinicoccus sp. HZC-1]|uniref:type II toxin-antitoxin system Phd/YefM family antitoxin n=1 Tax=Salinicoccus sp. HZC-1 TaxID=3385497 RepID=UPI00398BB706
MEIISAKNAKNDFDSLLKRVNKSGQPIFIGEDENDFEAVMISQQGWRSIQETLFLGHTGVLDKVRERETDDSGFTVIDEIDWETI